MGSKLYHAVLRTRIVRSTSEPSHQGLYGRPENAVKTQIWIALSVEVLMTIVRKELELQQSQFDIL